MAKIFVPLAMLGLILSAAATAVTVDRATFIKYGGSPANVRKDIRDAGVLDQLRAYSFAKPWLGVGNILFGTNICTATWIGEDTRWTYILTAAHCLGEARSRAMPISQTFRISKADASKAEVSATMFRSSGVIAEGEGTAYVPSGAQPLVGFADLTVDIAVVKLPRRMTPLDDSGVPLEQPILYDSRREDGRPFIVVGYGLWGVGGDVSFNYLPKSGAQRLYGRNVAIEFSSSDDLQRRGLAAYYDPWGPSKRWARTESGDSGAAWWQFHDGKPVIVGVTNKKTTEGDFSYAARVSGHIDWIRSVYPGVRVLSGESPKGCLVLADASRRKYCREPGDAFEELPEWMFGKDVEVQTDSGIEVAISNVTGLSERRVAVFTGTVENSSLRLVKARNGRRLDFRKPRAMRVQYSANKPLGCVVSLISAEKYCVPAPGPDYSGSPKVHELPAWIRGQDVFVQTDAGISVVLYDLQGNSATFNGRVENHQLKQARAVNGNIVDLSQAVSMSAVRRGAATPSQMTAID